MTGCPPPYDYRPDFTASEVDCVAPSYNEHRSRLEIGHAFFRSINQSSSENNIALEIRDDILPGMKTLYVRKYQEDHTTLILEEVFNVSSGSIPPAPIGGGSPTEEVCSPDDITALAVVVNNPTTGSTLIEMTDLGDDIYDERTEVTECLPTFPETFMTGGNGGPTDGSGLASIRTGPERTLIIIRTTENANGSDNPDVPLVRKIQQWDGFSWIPYCNRQPGECPGNDTLTCSS